MDAYEVAAFVEAVRRDRLDYVREVLRQTPSMIDAVDAGGKGVLFFVTSAEATSCLIQAGANVLARDPEGNTPLIWPENVAVAETLLNHGASIHVQRNDGWSPLHAAVYTNRVDLVALYLSKYADVNLADGDGETALHVAAGEGNIVIVELLLQHGANPDASNVDGFTPLHLAVMEEHPSIVAQLVRAGAQVGRRTATGLTALDFAEHQNNQSIIGLLRERDG